MVTPPPFVSVSVILAGVCGSGTAGPAGAVLAAGAARAADAGAPVVDVFPDFFFLFFFFFRPIRIGGVACVVWCVRGRLVI